MIQLDLLWCRAVNWFQNGFPLAWGTGLSQNIAFDQQGSPLWTPAGKKIKPEWTKMESISNCIMIQLDLLWFRAVS